jgi:hypothetical protein
MRANPVRLPPDACNRIASNGIQALCEPLLKTKPVPIARNLVTEVPACTLGRFPIDKPHGKRSSPVDVELSRRIHALPFRRALCPSVSDEWC